MLAQTYLEYERVTQKWSLSAIFVPFVVREQRCFGTTASGTAAPRGHPRAPVPYRNGRDGVDPSERNLIISCSFIGNNVL